METTAHPRHPAPGTPTKIEIAADDDFGQFTIHITVDSGTYRQRRGVQLSYMGALQRLIAELEMDLGDELAWEVGFEPFVRNSAAEEQDPRRRRVTVYLDKVDMDPKGPEREMAFKLASEAYLLIDRAVSK